MYPVTFRHLDHPSVGGHLRRIQKCVFAKGSMSLKTGFVVLNDSCHFLLFLLASRFWFFMWAKLLLQPTYLMHGHMLSYHSEFSSLWNQMPNNVLLLQLPWTWTKSWEEHKFKGEFCHMLSLPNLVQPHSCPTACTSLQFQNAAAQISSNSDF